MPSRIEGRHNNYQNTEPSLHLASLDDLASAGPGDGHSHSASSSFFRRRIEEHLHQGMQSASSHSVSATMPCARPPRHQQLTSARNPTAPDTGSGRKAAATRPRRSLTASDTRAASSSASLQLPPPRFPTNPLPLPRFAESAAVASLGAHPRVSFDCDPASGDDDDNDADASITSLSSLSSTLVEMHADAAPVVTTVVVRRTISRVEAQQRLDALRRRGLLPAGAKQTASPSS